MAEVLLQFDTTIRADDGTEYTPQVCTRRRPDGLWEGWIEFLPTDGRDGGEPLRSGRETEQADRDQVSYWASGLTMVYLQGALARARDAAAGRTTPKLTPRVVDATPRFDGPAPL